MAHTDVNPKDLADLGFSTYRDYMISEHWYAIRWKVLKRDDWKCSCCGSPADHVKLLEYSLPVLRGDELDKMAAICTKCYLCV